MRAGYPKVFSKAISFGHVKRRLFTMRGLTVLDAFRTPDGGPLFLDEIANVPLNLRAKLCAFWNRPISDVSARPRRVV